MVAAFHGYRDTMRGYRSRFRISQRGVTLADLRRYAEETGFKCRAVRLELEELAQLRRPAILHWDLDHFVVLRSVGRNRIRIVDPAVGERSLRLSEVSERFTGVALELTPTITLSSGPPLKPAAQRRQLADTVELRTFLPIFRGLGRSLGAVFLMTLALQVFGLIMPLNLQFTIDQGVHQGDWTIVMALAIGFGLVGLISATTEWLHALLVQYVANTASFRMVTGLAHHLLRLPDSWFVARHTGDVISRFRSTTPVGEFLMTGAFRIFVDAAMALGTFAVLLAYSWSLTMVLVGFLAFFAMLRFGTFGRLRNLTHETITAAAREESSFIENVERHRAIKLLGAETLREDAWGAHYVESINTDVRLIRFRAHVSYASGAVGAVQSVTMLMLGAGSVLDGTFSLGMLLAYSSYGVQFSTRAFALIESLVALRMLRLHRERIADIALEGREAPLAQSGIRRKLEGSVEVSSLCFAYGDRPLVLDGFDLSVSAGEFVAIEGESGAGKSTLVKLLTKLLVPSSGRILIDGSDIATLDTPHYRAQVGVVMQDDDLFSGSLLENIALVEHAADMARVEEAARLACIHEDIQQMPLEYLTLVGHMGATLSGGQRQRVMIARAIYRRPAMMLLDEGTAHLNDALQQRVFDNITGSGVTVIAITHDERVLARADRRVTLAPPGRTGSFARRP